MKKQLITILFLISVPNLFSFSGGNGTEASPYQISTKAHLELLADSVNNSAPPPADNWSKDKYFIVINNITDPIITIIGRNTRRFEGNFDGQNYTITLAINMSILSVAGLFGSVSSAVIENVIVNGYVSGNMAVAGIVGHSGGNTSIKKCINNANVSGDSYYIGGIIGSVIESMSITDCINMGNVSGPYMVGGIAGSTGHVGGNTSIINCINIGNISGDSIIGGVAGRIYNTSITNCINAGYVKGITGIGGILGIRPNVIGATTYITIENSINTGVVEGTGSVGAILGMIVGMSTITFINCHYDKQFCIHKGVNGEDVAGVSGHITRNMVGRKLASLLGDTNWTYVEGATLIECLYPQLKTLDHTDASKVGATPIFLYDGIKD
ncbi:MAG: hypothetical protein FWG85_04085 [Bacteroidetes bacterium]|nr:hypothetical protein [Bacteroidota bacterium]